MAVHRAVRLAQERAGHHLQHTPLYEVYPGWNFWVRDWRSVHEVIAPYGNVTNIHGHVHQPLYHETDNARFIGQLATSGRGRIPPPGCRHSPGR